MNTSSLTDPEVKDCVKNEPTSLDCKPETCSWMKQFERVVSTNILFFQFKRTKPNSKLELL
jgi:hypothetical protein